MSTGNIAFYFTPFFAGENRSQMTFVTFGKRIFFAFIGILGFTFCLTCLYLAMRGVMRLGGFVASGGPYNIAHQAPDWIWVFPVSFLASVFFIFLNQFNARRVGGINLMTILFPAVFLTLGWNFIEFGFNPPGNQSGYAWSWLVCAGFFILMGGIPFILLLKNVIKMFTGKIYVSPKKDYSRFYRDDKPGRKNNFFSARIVVVILFIINIFALAAGIYLAIGFFTGLLK